MARGKPGEIERYEDLYAYFRRHSNDYLLVEKKRAKVITVTRLGRSGDPLVYMETTPEEHLKLCIHYFHRVEVSNPSITIDSATINELVDKLAVPREIFKHG